MRILKMNLAVLIGLMFFAGTALLAQHEEDIKKEKKVVIITKTVDANGNVQTEKVIKEGADADVFIMKQELGENEKHENIDVDVDTQNGEKKVRIRINQGIGDDVEVIEWDGTDEVPEDLHKVLKEKGIKLEMIDEDNIFYLDTDDAPNSACLGVMIGKKETIENINGEETIVVEGESELGVSVLDIIENSGAQDAGLAQDDIIAKINGTEVSTMGGMLDVLSPLEIGDIVNVDYYRDGVLAQVNATLKACSDHTGKEVEEEIEWTEEEPGRKVIIKKRKVGDNEMIKEIEIEEGEFDALQGNHMEKEQSLDLESIDIFPNPTDGKLTVKFKAPAVSTIVKIVDLSGREVYNEELNRFDGNYNKEIDLHHAPKGALILSIQQADKIFSEKLILQRK